MKHRINGCLINLRTLTDAELENLADRVADRIADSQEQLDSLRGEQVRRSSNVIPLFGAADVPPYLLDPA